MLFLPLFRCRVLILVFILRLPFPLSLPLPFIFIFIFVFVFVFVFVFIFALGSFFVCCWGFIVFVVFVVVVFFLVVVVRIGWAFFFGGAFFEGWIIGGAELARVGLGEARELGRLLVGGLRGEVVVFFLPAGSIVCAEGDAGLVGLVEDQTGCGLGYGMCLRCLRCCPRRIGWRLGMSGKVQSKT